jgi:hypothetical protein
MTPRLVLGLPLFAALFLFDLILNLIRDKPVSSLNPGRLPAFHGGHHDHLVFQVAARCFQHFEALLMVVQKGVERSHSQSSL